MGRKSHLPRRKRNPHVAPGSSGTQRINFKIESKRSEIQLQTTHLEEKAFEDFSVNREELMHGTFEEVDENPASKRIAELKEKSGSWEM